MDLDPTCQCAAKGLGGLLPLQSSIRCWFSQRALSLQINVPIPDEETFTKT